MKILFNTILNQIVKQRRHFCFLFISSLCNIMHFCCLCLYWKCIVSMNDTIVTWTYPWMNKSIFKYFSIVLISTSWNLGFFYVFFYSIFLMNAQYYVFRLSGCELSWRSCKTLSRVLSSQSSTLEVLDLNNNDLTDLAVTYLFTPLKTQLCTLKIVR